MLTFKQWQDSRTKNRRDNQYTYSGECVIDINQGRAIDTYGRYCLTIGNWSEASNDLSTLEHELYTQHYVPNHTVPDHTVPNYAAPNLNTILNNDPNDDPNDDRNCVDFHNGTEL